MNKTITGLIIVVTILVGIVGFLVYSTQDQLDESIIRLTNPCLDTWNEINRSGSVTNGERLTEYEGELFFGIFAENNCRQNLDWLPEDHPDYVRVHEMWGNR